MKCDRCENEATVHEVKVEKGKQVEKHLCEQCAKEEGFAIQSHTPINALLTKFVVSNVQKGEAASRSPSCPECGLTYAEFRQHGLLGCPDCYEAFEEQLTPLLERAQEGGTHHIGKTPRRAGASLDRQRLVATLRKQLSEALQSEHYERAAELRDALRNVGQEKDRPDGSESTEHAGPRKNAGSAASRSPKRGSPNGGESSGGGGGTSGGGGGGGGGGSRA